jgi:hypothetical protein
MKTIELHTGESPYLKLKKIGGSLRITGKSDGILEIKAHENSNLIVTEKTEWIEVDCHSNCTIFTPEGARFEINTIGGELFLTGVQGQIEIKTIGGDARLRRTGPLTISMVGGDLSARGVQGDLSADRVGGDGLVEQISGMVRLKRVGGDLRISQVQDSIQVEAGGDGVIDLSPEEGTTTEIRVGGDLLFRISPDSSARIQLQAGGETAWTLAEESIERINDHVIQLGEGAATLNLQAGGDLQLDGESFRVEEGKADLGEAIAARISAEIEAEMAEIEAKLGGIRPAVSGIDAEVINRKIQRAMTKAQRKAERARRKAEERSRRSNRMTKTSTIRLGIEDLDSSVTDQERQMVLKMLESGKITVEEAEQLLEALEGKT